MEGKLLAVLAVLVLTGVGFAGCMSQPEFAASSDTEVSAKRYAELAATSATGWDPKASLVGVGAAETRDEDADLPADPDVGNGLATAWSYIYQSASGEHRAFEVGADGTVVSKNESDAAADYGGMYSAYGSAYNARSGSAREQPVSGWTWDSDAALGVAMENETFAKAVHAANASLAEGLGASGMPAAWGFLATSPKGPTVLAVINATDGEVIGIHDFSRYSWGEAQSYASAKAPPAPAPTPKARPVQIKDTGSLSAAAPTKQIPFSASGPLTGRLNLTARFSGDATSVGWKIVNGSKTVASGSVGGFGDATGPQTTSVTVKVKEAGDYALVLSLSTLQPVAPVGSASYDVLATLLPS